MLVEPEPSGLAIRSGDLPDGTLHRTSRTADFEDVCAELAKADVIYVGDAFASADHARLSLQVLRQLHARGRLDGIGLARFDRSQQAALDEFSRVRIDSAELTARTGVDAGDASAVLDFAREHRIPLVALAVEPDLLAAVATKGHAGLSEEQLSRLPADADAFATTPAAPAEQATRLADEVMADTIVRWRRASPEAIQLLVFAPAEHVAHRRCLPRRARERTGGKHMTMVLRRKSQLSDAMLAHGFADFVWVFPN